MLLNLGGLASFVLRTVCIYLVALAVVRLMGKRALGTLSLFDFVITVGIGDIIVLVGVEGTVTFLRGIQVLAILGVLELLFSVLTYRSPLAARILEGQPTVLVKEGRMIEENMRREHVSLSDLKQELRKHGVARISDVDRAVLEACGKFSVIIKEESEPMSRKETMSEFDELQEIKGEMAEMKAMLAALCVRGSAPAEPAESRAASRAELPDTGAND